MEVRMTKVMSKSELIQKIAEQHSDKNMARKDVKAVIESLAAIGYKELNKSGAFLGRALPNSLSSRSQQQRSAAASIRSQRNQQALKFGRRRSNRRAKRELCPGYERSSRHNLCKGTVFLDLAL
jgi:hypothetical protein